MRIGILTLPLHTNYGGILQAYALQKVLQKMGHEVEVIDKPHHYDMPVWKLFFLFPQRIVGKYFFKNKDGIFREWVFNKKYPIISEYTEPFLKHYINRYETINYPVVEQGRYECIIVGSDQIWRRRYHKKITPVFLDYTKGWVIKRIAYAASFGTDRWEYSDEETRICKELVSSFDAISVREMSGVELCRNNLGISATHVLDPTMLLECEDYIKLFRKKNIEKSKGSIMCYILNPSEMSSFIINRVKTILRLSDFSVISKFFDSFKGGKDNIQPPIEKWLRGFYDAEFVITDSFHACVFSIIFRKPFVVIANESRGVARIKSLLMQFGLEDRLVLNPDRIEIVVDTTIDFDRIDRIRKMEKSLSINYLKNALS